MKFSSTKLKWLKPFIILMIVAHLYSCSSWKVMKEPYNKQIDEEKHKMVKVELVNGKKIELHNPSIQGDDLIGIIITENKKRFQIQKHISSIALKDIKHFCWDVGKKPYKKQINEEKLKLVEIELINGRKIMLHNPSIEGDRLTGLIIPENMERFQKHTVSISLLHIKQIKEYKYDKDITILMICLGIGMAALVTYGIISALSFEWNQ